MFHRLSQTASEKFDDFVHEVEANAAQCSFKWAEAWCTIPDTLIRDQMIIGTNNADIRNELLKKNIGKLDLLKEGCVIESGSDGQRDKLQH